MNFIKILRFLLLISLLLCGCAGENSSGGENEKLTELPDKGIASQELLTAVEHETPEFEELQPSVTPTFTPTPDVLACLPTNTRRVVGRVIEVLDGDTIKVRVGTLVYTVRYIGIDAPSAKPGINDYEYFGDEATAKNKELVDGETVTIITDVSDMDNFGRLIRYVMVGDTFVNYEMAAQGYARSYVREPDIACQQLIDQAENEAIQTQRGMWNAGGADIIENENAILPLQEEMTPTPSAEAQQTPFVYENPRDCIPATGEVENGQVVSVVDGDTIRVRIDGEVYAVRYIGVDAPQPPVGTAEGDYFGEEAFKRNERLVNKKEVILIRDKSDMDNFGRKLRYVIMDDVFVNYDMIANGFAFSSPHDPDTSCTGVFTQAEQEARQRMSGVWLFWSLPVVDENATSVP